MKPSDVDQPATVPAPSSFALWAPIVPTASHALVTPTFTRAPDLVIPSDVIVHAVAICRWCRGQFRRIDDGAHWLCVSEACAERQMAGAVLRASCGAYESPYLYVPLPLQVDIDESPVKHLLVAGAAGTAKSYGARWGLYRRCRQVSGYRALLLRSSYPEVDRNHLQYMTREGQQLGDARYVGFQIREMRFSNDSLIFAGSCDDERAISRHLGNEFDEIIADEAVTFLPQALNQIMPRARGSQPARATMAALGIEPRTRCVSNPGGRAMLYLIEQYIRRDPDPFEYPTYERDNYGYISATLEDNPFLKASYERDNLSGLSRARYRQLRYGDWTALAGQFFEEFDESIHVTDDPYRMPVSA